MVSNPPNDPGRRQTPENKPDCSVVRGGKHRDEQSMTHNPIGSATTYKMWATQADENDREGKNGPVPRDRGHRS